MHSPVNARGLFGLAALSLLVAGGVLAGPLNPPAGPVTSTGRTLDEIYNRIPAVGSGDGRTPISAAGTISAPGSYVLTSNINVTSGNGITINASNVTLDLNGFSVASTANTGNGILVNINSSGLVLRNGRVSGFGVGVSVGAGSVDSLVFEDLEIRDAKTSGIFSSSTSAKTVQIRRCTILDTGSTTTAADGNMIIRGISLSGGGHIIQDCVVARLIYNGSGTATFQGIVLADGTATGVGNLVSGCTVTDDGAITGTGIILLGNSSVRRNNTVLLFSTPYSGGIDGGGNI